MLKKIIGALAVVVVIGIAWFFTQGPGVGILHHAQDVQAPLAPATAPTVQQAPAVQKPDFQPVQDALQSIKQNGIVRISNENPSEPFFGVSGAVPHGFNVEFAKMVFGDPAFASNTHPEIVTDFSHSVDNYAGVPQQLLTKDSAGYVTDIAMDGLTFPDNTPQGVVYSVPYIDEFGYALIVQKGSSIRSVADLEGKTIGILKGDPDVKAFVSRQISGAHTLDVDDADPHFIDKAIDSHQVDAFIYDYPFAVESIKNTDLVFAVTKLDGAEIAYKIGVRSSDQTLLLYLNATIAKVKSTAAYHDLLVKYFVSNQATVTAAVSGERKYTVRAGDTLHMIASSQLGNGNRWTDIQKRNNLPNPNLIQVGQVLVIPQR